MKKDTKTLAADTPSSAVRRIAAVMTGLIAVMLVLLPFHAFLTVWGSSLVGNYTLLRLWKEALLAVLLVGGFGVVIVDRRRLLAGFGGMDGFWRRHVLIGLISAYLLLLGVAGILALVSTAVTPKAFAYGLLLDSRFLVFFGVVWLVCRYNKWLVMHWRRLLLVPAALVVVFGLLQFTVLPNDFLAQFGYGPATIDAVQTVDEKQGYQRVQSTLRGANPLGAYLIIILAATGVLILRKRPAYRWLAAVLLACSCLVLAMTFSRSAWLGALAALGWLLVTVLRTAQARRMLLVGGAVGLLAFAAVGYSLRQNDVFQNTFLHTDENSQSAVSSNQGHVSATREAIGDIMRQPFGGGTGTAGPASVYNDHPARIAENYYLQIGQEIGIIGLLLFVAINLAVGRALWCRNQPLPRMLLASLIGISVVNLLSHAWTDDTLAYVWWGLAGVAMSLPSLSLPASAVNSTEATALPGSLVADADDT